MSDAHLMQLAARLADAVGSDQRDGRGDIVSLDADRYLDPMRWSRERDSVFRRFPLISARSDELDAQQRWLGRDLAGTSVLLHRDEHGATRAYLNSCRHRGMQLLADGEHGCRASIACPYHGWTYASDGSLRGLPHADAFPGLEREAHALVEIPCAEAHGFVWVVPTPSSPMQAPAEWLDSIDDDLRHFDLAGHVTFAEGRSVVDGNWKLCIDAFLEAYHVRVLHRNTVGPFFHDALACFDAVGPHTRSAVARRESGPDDTLRDRVSFTHFVFPNQVFVFHPDYVSQMSILPRNESSFDWHHRMLIPAEHDTPEQRAHWQKSYELIENGVFQAEDLRAVERLHAGLLTGATPRITTAVIVSYCSRSRSSVANIS